MSVYVLKIAIVMLFLDFLYLKFISSSFDKMITNIQGKPLQLKLIPTILCYCLLVSVFYYFISKGNRTITEAFFLGFAIYGIYDTTNMATIDAWNWNIVAIDTLWGGSLFALTHLLTTKIF